MINDSPARRVAEIAEYNLVRAEWGVKQGLQVLSFDPADIALLLSSRETMQQNHQHEIDRWLSWRSATVEEIETLETRIKELEGALHLIQERPYDEADKIAGDALQGSTMQSALLNARREAGEAMRERCRKVALDETEPLDCERLGIMDPGTGARECSMRDCLCVEREETADRIATAIALLALPSDTQGRGDGG